MDDCIFCSIASGRIPSDKVYEDDLVIAFMDINPVQRGHVLVIPRRHSESVLEMSEEEAAGVALAVRKLAGAVMEATGAEGFNVLNNCGRVAGQAVAHVHFHIIPRRGGDGRGYRWVTLEYEEGERERLAERIAGLV